MTTLTASEARANLYRLIDQAADSYQPILIAGKRNNAVLLSAEDWQAIQETLQVVCQVFRRSIPALWILLQALQTDRLQIARDRQTQLARAAVSKPLRLTLRPGAVLKNHQSESTVGGCRR